MSTCVRCGDLLCRWHDYQQQAAHERSDGAAAACALDCRDRELANLRSLLRSVTGKLERASQALADGMPHLVERELDRVLEILS